MSRLAAFGVAVVLLIVVVGGIALIKGGQIGYMIEAGENFQQPPTAVSMTKVERQTWPRTLTAVGTLEADQGMMLKAEINGRISKVHFESGQNVKAGDVLVEQESGNEKAQLRAAEARLDLAKSTLKRLEALREQQSVSESAFDEARQQVASAEADVDNLKTTLAKKRIVAPFSGRLGLRQIYAGQDLQAGTQLVSIQAVDSLKVNFNVPQIWLNKIKPGYGVNVTTRTGETMRGEVVATAAEIDPLNRNLTIQARIPNKDKALIPGLAVDVEVELPDPQVVLAIPTSAILFATYGDTVFVVNPAENGGPSTVRQQFIRLGDRRGDFTAVEAGLEEGQTIVTSGGFKLFNGMAVTKSDKPEPDVSLNPQPNDA